jgi:prolyl-tRNA editing enzyme YbaK/EbsC (Cys-tRNA(Pro) deacylase)
LAAGLLSCSSGEIAKTLAFRLNRGCILIVAAGDAKVDNSKFKAVFGSKAVMLKPEEAEELVGHAVGGVCPFAVKRVFGFIWINRSTLGRYIRCGRQSQRDSVIDH